MIEIYRTATIAIQNLDYEALEATVRHVQTLDIQTDERRALCSMLEAMADVIYDVAEVV